MRSATLSAAALALLVGNVVAFPRAMLEDYQKAQKRQTGPPLPVTPPPFNAAQQYVSNQGEHAFVAPGPGDQRGPCPGLNALANHGYLPHNGNATAAQFIQATEAGFGMAKDLGGFLAFYGSWVDGNGAGWSINGGPHTGIGGSHNDYETDSSPLKADLNQYGSNRRLIMSQFYELYNLQPDAATANYDLSVMRQFRDIRFKESVAKNPYFFYGPFTGIEVSQAAFTFIYRFMSNKSAEHPEGVLNKDVLKSFMAIQGPENALTWVPGNERIPDNWYKRNPADEYSIEYFQTDIIYFAETVPEVLEVGCNTGTVNSYKPFSPRSISGGAYNKKMVAAQPLCFAMQMSLATAPTLLSGKALTGLTNTINKALSSFKTPCPTIALASMAGPAAYCPGFSFYGGPDGPVAPGAIQS